MAMYRTAPECTAPLLSAPRRSRVHRTAPECTAPLLSAPRRFSGDLFELP